MQIKEKNRQTQTLTKPTGESFTFNIVEVEGGTFTMGLNGKGDDEKPAHQVKLDSFLAAEYPVTQDLYELVMGANPSRFLGKRKPVERVNLYDAVEFCNKLSELVGLESYYKIDKERKDPNNENEYDDKKWLVEFEPTANGYRLPTEAEWEYAARGGKYWEESFEFSGSNELKTVAWYNENSHSESVPVGLKAPNKLGLYDMSGNLYEWCWDWFDENYYKGSLEKSSGNFLQKLFGQSNTDSSDGIRINPIGAEKGKYRVVRGGSWLDIDDICRVANRLIVPNHWDLIRGFRIFRGL